MPDHTHVIAGRCTTEFEGTREREQLGDVIVIIKPDNTVLVHDTDGYQPVAWLTRPENVTVTDKRVTASDGNQRLEVTCHDVHARTQYAASEAGVPVGTCPSCESRLVRARGTVTCVGCDDEFPLPANGVVLDERCEKCAMPMLRVQRGDAFEVCLDPGCDPLDEHVREAFDRKWDCPDCEGDLRVLRRGGLLLGCDNYPDCETSFSFPDGVHAGECACGLPAFEAANRSRCLDSQCDRAETVAAASPD